MTFNPGVLLTNPSGGVRSMTSWLFPGKGVGVSPRGCAGK